jgi:hypothetical protein
MKAADALEFMEGTAGYALHTHVFTSYIPTASL